MSDCIDCVFRNNPRCRDGWSYKESCEQYRKEPPPKPPSGCHDCFYMRKDNTTTVENMVDKVIQFIPVMECRRQPPLGSKNLMEGGIWHRVKGCDWCGEWREKA